MNLELKNTGTTLLDLYYLMLELVLKNTRTILLDLDWLYLFYDILDLDLRNTQHKDYLSGLTFILLNIGLGLINQPSRDVVTKVWRFSRINCFLHLSLVLIHAVFAALSFANFCMMISLPTLLCFLCSSGYCMSLWHFAFYLGFLSRPFTNHRTAGEEAGHFFSSSLPLPPASQTLRH